MRKFLYAWLISFLLVIVIDLVWLIIMVPNFYQSYIGHLLKDELDYKVPLLFYTIYSFGICYLIVFPSLQASTITMRQVSLYGFVLGLVAYGTYDLTNQATLKDWPIIVTIVDMLWGGVLTMIVSTYAYKILNKKGLVAQRP